MSIDPITLEIMSNGLQVHRDETYIALMKSAYSTNIKERHDHSTAIVDPRGRLIAQAENSLADPPRLDDGPDEHAACQNAALRRCARATSSSPTTRMWPAARICPTSTWRCRCSPAAARLLRLQHRASRRHRRHRAGQHGGRHVGDLPGGPAHPGHPAYSARGELDTTCSICSCSTCACPRSAAATISPRSPPAGSACGACRAVRGARRARCSSPLRRHHPPHGGAHARRRSPRIAPGEYRFEDVMDDDGLGTTQHSDQAAHRGAAARQQSQGAVRLHRLGAAGAGQHQLAPSTRRRRACSIRSRRCSIRTCRTIRA